ncbi:MAG: PHP domain-containing protein, partial [Planctomycetota bacterium]
MQYVELHCKSNFSFLEGASHADELVQQALELGYRGLAITDRNTLAGVVRAHTAAKDAQLPLYVGSELHPVDGPPVLVWPRDRAGYGNLSRIITRGRLRREKGACEIYWSDIADLNEGLFAGLLLRQPVIDEVAPAETVLYEDEDVMPWEFQDSIVLQQPDQAPVTETEPQASVGSQFAVNHQFPDCNFDPRDDAKWLEWLHAFREIFGQRASLMLELHRGVDDAENIRRLQVLSERSQTA